MIHGVCGPIERLMRHSKPAWNFGYSPLPSASMLARARRVCSRIAEVLVQLADLARHRGDVARLRGDLRARRVDADLRLREGRVAVDVPVDAELVVLQRAADAFELDAGVGECEIALDVFELHGRGL